MAARACCEALGWLYLGACYSAVFASAVDLLELLYQTFVEAYVAGTATRRSPGGTPSACLSRQPAAASPATPCRASTGAAGTFAHSVPPLPPAWGALLAAA